MLQSTISKQEVRKLVGKAVYVMKKDGTVVNGKLVRLKGNTLHLSTGKGKKASTKAIIPLVLFDLLAIGTSPFAFGGFGPVGFGGFGPVGFGGGFDAGFGGFGGFDVGFGGPFFW